LLLSLPFKRRHFHAKSGFATGEKMFWVGLKLLKHPANNQFTQSMWQWSGLFAIGITEAEVGKMLGLLSEVNHHWGWCSFNEEIIPWN